MKKIILTLMVIILISGCVEEYPDKPQSIYYAGAYRNFRGNLSEAIKVPTYPDEHSVRNILLNPIVNKVHIAYIPHDTENASYFVSSFEIVIKLGTIYKHNFQENREADSYKAIDGSSCLAFYLRDVPESLIEKCFKSTALNSTADAFQIAKEDEPVILLLGPSQTNDTRVTVRDYVITAEGADLSKTNRTWTDLDLAVDKIILILMQD